MITHTTKLKSDYFRIEIKIHPPHALPNNTLKSDYFRIEITSKKQPKTD